MKTNIFKITPKEKKDYFNYIKRELKANLGIKYTSKENINRAFQMAFKSNIYSFDKIKEKLDFIMNLEKL